MGPIRLFASVDIFPFGRFEAPDPLGLVVSVSYGGAVGDVVEFGVEGGTKAFGTEADSGEFIMFLPLFQAARGTNTDTGVIVVVVVFVKTNIPPRGFIGFLVGDFRKKKQVGGIVFFK